MLWWRNWIGGHMSDLYRSVWEYKHYFGRKKTHPPGGFPVYYVSWSRTRSKRTPLEALLDIMMSRTTVATLWCHELLWRHHNVATVVRDIIMSPPIPNQEPGGRGPPSKQLVKILRGTLDQVRIMAMIQIDSMKRHWIKWSATRQRSEWVISKAMFQIDSMKRH